MKSSAVVGLVGTGFAVIAAAAFIQLGASGGLLVSGIALILTGLVVASMDWPNRPRF